MSFTVHADRTVALDSPDHTHPLGCLADNSRSSGFVRKALGLFPHAAVLDLGCAGGGMVWDFLCAGCEAVGIEGSPLPGNQGRGQWPEIGGHNLFTADATRPFRVRRDGKPWRADVVTAWEFLEHVADSDLAAVVANIRRHIAPRGVFVASIATFPDPPRHQTVQPAEWWYDRLGAMGLVNDDELCDYFAPDWVRDQGARGFHVVARPAWFTT